MQPQPEIELAERPARPPSKFTRPSWLKIGS